MKHNGGGMVSKGLRAFFYQVTVNFGADYYATKTTETLINYTACVCPAWASLPYLRYGINLEGASPL